MRMEVTNHRKAGGSVVVGSVRAEGDRLVLEGEIPPQVRRTLEGEQTLWASRGVSVEDYVAKLPDLHRGSTFITYRRID